ncbi:hypothetical protein B0T17DRAFT_74861 [Bombardia bombarda]|uniref:Uncharacterized protein n=1 Tax=Bombardia bombarda TaxID=252184 RepID=A0AA40CFE8_9PEZI|nr:hypothetical protein B0T17DRAFT_74861 [Bombardia bombarda]
MRWPNCNHPRLAAPPSSKTCERRKSPPSQYPGPARLSSHHPTDRRVLGHSQDAVVPNNEQAEPDCGGRPSFHQDVAACGPDTVIHGLQTAVQSGAAVNKRRNPTMDVWRSFLCRRSYHDVDRLAIKESTSRAAIKCVVVQKKHQFCPLTAVDVDRLVSFGPPRQGVSVVTAPAGSQTNFKSTSIPVGRGDFPAWPRGTHPPPPCQRWGREDTTEFAGVVCRGVPGCGHGGHAPVLSTTCIRRYPLPVIFSLHPSIRRQSSCWFRPIGSNSSLRRLLYFYISPASRTGMRRITNGCLLRLRLRPRQRRESSMHLHFSPAWPLSCSPTRFFPDMVHAD